MDKRKISSKRNGALGGRPSKSDMGRVVIVLLRGLKRLTELEPPTLEAIVSLAQRRLIHQATMLVSGFDEVIAESRSVYLSNLQKLGQPNSVDTQQELRKKLDVSAREIRGYLRILAVKADVILQDIREQSLKIDSVLEIKLEKISKIEAKGLDQVVELIIGIVDESLDQFGSPLYS